MEAAALLSLAIGVLVFNLVKALFTFLAFLFPEADAVHRRHLDSAVDALDKHTLFDLGQTTLVRLLQPIDAFFRRGRASYAALVFVSFAQNAVVFTVAASLVVASHFQTIPLGLGAVLFSIREAGVLKFGAMNALVASLGTLFDLLSIWITLVLIRRASHAKTGTGLLGHVAVDAAVAFVSCMWAYMMVGLALLTYYENIEQSVRFFSGGEADKYLAETLWGTLSVNPAMWYVIVGLGASAALPTLAYLLALVPVLAFRLVPRAAQNALSRVVFQLTTDKDSVLKQLSSFASHLAALLGALLAWLKFSP